jgi:hypothetical protein
MESKKININQLAIGGKFNNIFTNPCRLRLHYNLYYNAYVAHNYKSTINKLYGTNDFLRDFVSFRYGFGKFLKYFFILLSNNQSESLVLDSFLPRGSVVYIKPNVLVVICGINDIVIKIENHIYSKIYHEIIKKSWTAFKAVGMENFLPEYLDGGETAEPHVYFTKTRLCPNKPPLFRSYKGKAWPDVLEKRVLPVLQEFHSRNGFELMDGPEWAHLIESKFENRNVNESTRKALQGTLAKLRDFKGKLMPVGMISADLQPQNVHFFGRQVKFLDWSNIKNAALLIDVICDLFYPARVSPLEKSSVEFWDFLCGKKSLIQLPRLHQEYFNVWKRSIVNWLGLDVTEEIYRLQLDGVCWDWMGTMEHVWSPVSNKPWETINFPERYIFHCMQNS